MGVKKNRLWDTVFLMTVGVLFAWSVVAAILSTTVFQDAHLQSLIRVFLVIAVVRLLFSHKLLQWGSAIGLFLGFGFLVYGFLTYSEEPGLSQAVVWFLSEMVAYVGGHLEYRLLFEQVIVWSITIAVGLSVVIWAYVFPFFFLLFAVFSALFAVVLISPFFNFHLAFYVFIFSALAYLVRQLSLKTATETSREMPEEGRGKRGMAPVLSAVGLAVFCMLFASFLPIPQADARSPFQALNDVIYSATSPGEFAIRHIGFSGGGGRLGGNIAPNDNIFMFVRTNRYGSFYLTGAIMDTYTGNSWENRSAEGSPFDFDEMEPRLAFFERASSNAAVSLLRYEVYGFSFSIEGLFPLRTMDVFTASSTYAVFFPDIVEQVFAPDIDVTFLRDQRGQLSTLDRMPVSTAYTLVYRTLDAPLLDTAEADFAQNRMLLYSYRGILRDVSQVFEDFRMERIYSIPTLSHLGMTVYYEYLLHNYLIPRAEWIHETYTTLPEDFPERVGDLARATTAEAESDFERARLLELHLSTHYYYTLTPGPSPRNRDFVDHFLFDLQAGYCVHFASAFVTMARSIGLPARYIEGFLVSGSPEEAHGHINVRNNMGHAWAEVYFEGYGWHLFEPTPGFSVPGAPTYLDESGFPQFHGPQDVEVGGFPDGTNFLLDDDDLFPPEYELWPDAPQQQTPTEPPFEGRLWPMIVLVSLFLLTLAAIRILWISLRRVRVDRLEHREAVLFYFGVLLRYMNCFGLTIRNAETAAQFMTRVEGPPQVAPIFAKARYSEGVVTLEEREEMANAVQQMDTKLRNSLGKVRYLFYKYLLGRI